MKTIETKISKSGATIYYVDGKRTNRENAMFIQRMNDAEVRRLAKIEAEKADEPETVTDDETKMTTIETKMTVSELKEALKASRNKVRLHFTAKGNPAWQSVYRYGKKDHEIGYCRISKREANERLAEFGLTANLVIEIGKAKAEAEAAQCRHLCIGQMGAILAKFAKAENETVNSDETDEVKAEADTVTDEVNDSDEVKDDETQGYIFTTTKAYSGCSWQAAHYSKLERIDYRCKILGDSEHFDGSLYREVVFYDADRAHAWAVKTADGKVIISGHDKPDFDKIVEAVKAYENAEVTEAGAQELPAGTIEVDGGAKAFELAAKYFPDGLKFKDAHRWINGAYEYTFTDGNDKFLHATCDRDNTRVECLEVVDTNESGSKRKPLFIIINPPEISEVDAAETDTDEVNDDDEKLAELFEDREVKRRAALHSSFYSEESKAARDANKAVEEFIGKVAKDLRAIAPEGLSVVDSWDSSDLDAPKFVVIELATDKRTCYGKIAQVKAALTVTKTVTPEENVEKLFDAYEAQNSVAHISENGYIAAVNFQPHNDVRWHCKIRRYQNLDEAIDAVRYVNEHDTFTVTRGGRVETEYGKRNERTREYFARTLYGVEYFKEAYFDELADQYAITVDAFNFATDCEIELANASITDELNNDGEDGFTGEDFLRELTVTLDINAAVKKIVSTVDKFRYLDQRHEITLTKPDSEVMWERDFRGYKGDETFLVTEVYNHPDGTLSEVFLRKVGTFTLPTVTVKISTPNRNMKLAAETVKAEFFATDEPEITDETDEDAHNTTEKIEVAIGADAMPAMIDLFEPNKITLNTPAQILKLIEDAAGNSFSFDYESYFINTDDDARHKFITRHFVSECKNYSFIEIFTDDGKLDCVEFLKHFLAGYKEVKFYLAAPAQDNVDKIIAEMNKRGCWVEYPEEEGDTNEKARLC